MQPHIAGQTFRLSRQQAENLLLYPELLARVMDELRYALEQRVKGAGGRVDSHIDVMIIAEMLYLTPDEDDEVPEPPRHDVKIIGGDYDMVMQCTCDWQFIIDTPRAKDAVSIEMLNSIIDHHRAHPQERQDG